MSKIDGRSRARIERGERSAASLQRDADELRLVPPLRVELDSTYGVNTFDVKRGGKLVFSSSSLPTVSAWLEGIAYGLGRVEQ